MRVMKFPPIYTISTKARELVEKLKIHKSTFALRNIDPSVLIQLRRKTLLKSSLYSARIEGNPLTLEEISTHVSDADIHVQEVGNLVSSYEKLPSTFAQEMSVTLLKQFHRWILSGIGLGAGYFRNEESAIFNQAGIAVYLSPAPFNIPTLTNELCTYIVESKDSVPVVAAVSHVWFEKIHPFLDGNGRVGRLLSSWILSHGGYDFSGLVSFEEYLESHRSEYYSALGKETQDVSLFIDFYLEALHEQVIKSFSNISDEVSTRTTNLLPRREEIYATICDHDVVSFDFIRRRFLRVSERTLHYDLQQLIKEKYITKIGSTRGVLYKRKN